MVEMTSGVLWLTVLLRFDCIHLQQSDSDLDLLISTHYPGDARDL